MASAGLRLASSRLGASGVTPSSAEGALDRLFANGQAAEASLAERMRDVGAAQSEVRRLHLKTHISTRAALTAEQTALYAKHRS